MRTTLDLDDELMRLVRQRARDSERTVTAVIEDAIRQALTGVPARPKPFRLRWKTTRGRLLPGVDLSNRDALYEIMEGRS